MSDKNVFLKAIDVLNERGWTQEDVEDEQGRVCLVEAVYQAWLADRSLHVDWDLLGTVTCGSSDAAAISHWNDNSHTSYEDVIRVLKEAAVSWDGA